MKYCLCALALLCTYVGPARAEICVNSFAHLEALLFGSQKEVYGRGCCSWHGGVCGCTLSRIKCCDGTLSPSCEC